MLSVGRAGVNGDVACVGVTHQVAVGAGAGHHTGVGRGEAHHVFQKRHRLQRIPVKVVHDLAVRADHFQLSVGVLVLHVAGFLAAHKACAWTTRPQRLFVGGTDIQYILHGGIGLQPLQRTNGREDNKKVFGLVPGQRVGGAHPQGLKLLGFIGHRRLALRHARHQKWHVKTARQIAVGDPVGQHKDFVSGQRQAPPGTLRSERGFAIQRGDVLRIYCGSVGMPRQQDAQFFKAFTDRSNGLGQM